MEDVSAKFTVYFEPPFWVGVYERQDGDLLEACKVTFGAEPKDYEVFAFLLQNWHKLRFSPQIKIPVSERNKYSPKRAQRQIRRQLSKQGAGTKAQQALKKQQEEGKLARKKKARQKREEDKQRLFELQQQKKKQKHRGH
jgi:hypothetical protein